MNSREKAALKRNDFLRASYYLADHLRRLAARAMANFLRGEPTDFNIRRV